MLLYGSFDCIEVRRHHSIDDQVLIRERSLGLNQGALLGRRNDPRLNPSSGIAPHLHGRLGAIFLSVLDRIRALRVVVTALIEALASVLLAPGELLLKALLAGCCQLLLELHHARLVGLTRRVPQVFVILLLLLLLILV